MSETKTTRITAIPCGRNRDGEPIARRYDYELVREPEPYGERAGRAFSRLWGLDKAGSRALDRDVIVPLAVVWTDSIEVREHDGEAA